MKIKTMLLAVAAVTALAFAALPALAAADSVDYPGAGNFSVTGGATALSVPAQESVIECESATGGGQFTSSTTGTMQLLFHGCKIENAFECHSEGQPSGTITTTTLPFHIKRVSYGSNEHTPAVLITPNNGHFATIYCVFELVEIVVGGNGVIGHITSGYTTSSTATIAFNAPGGAQEFTTVVGESTEYGLEAEVEEEGPYAATQEGTGTIHFSEGNATITE